jgi:uncharacterized Tic20 family protein
MEKEDLTPTERTTAVVAHASLLLAWLGFPVFLPLFTWMGGKNATQRCRFEMLQALGWQSLFMLYAPLSVLLILTLGGIGLAISMGFPSVREAPETAIIVFVVGVSLAALVLLLLYHIPALIAVIRSIQGKSYLYPWVGNLMEKTSNADDGEFRWVAAVGHLSILIPIYGILVPLVLSISKDKHSELLQRQGRQAAVYQLVAPLLGVLIFAGWLMVTLVFLFSAGLPGAPLPLEITHAANQVVLAAYWVISILTILYMLFLPLYTTLPLIAAWRVLQGRDYSYPLLRRLGGLPAE